MCVSQLISAVNKVKNTISPFPSMLDGITDSMLIYGGELRIWMYRGGFLKKVNK